MDTGSGSYAAVIALKRGCKFVNFSNGKLGKIDRGLFGSAKMDDQTSVAFFEDGNKCVSGSPKGYLTIWMGNKATKSFNIHNGAIHAVTCKEGKILTSGYSDKTLKVWNGDDFSNPECTFELTSYARSLDICNGKIICGTRFGEIWQFENG